jgi:hypothetical protein
MQADSPVKGRRSFSLKYKRGVLNSINDLMLQGYSLRRAAEELKIPHGYYKTWRRTVAKADSLRKDEAVHPFTINGEVRKLHPGRPTGLGDFQNSLTRSVFELREQGLQVNTRTVRKEASRLSEIFKDKTKIAKVSCIRRFVKRVGLRNRVSIHVAQKNHQETEEESSHFLVLMKQKLSGMNPDDVINMDQTPIPFTFPSNRTLEKKGTKTIHVRTSTTDTKRATLAATVTGSGKLLTPFLIFKGKSNGRIAAKELQTYPNECIYACQEKAWMDEVMMHKWIDLVLIPWKESRNPGVIPVLILDAYRVHMMGSVVNRIQSLGIEVQHIPAGCTYLCQPVDVGINRPIKVEMTEQSEEWMVSGGGVADGVAKTPSRAQVAEWIVGAYKAITEQTGRNAWRKTGYEWF